MRRDRDREGDEMKTDASAGQCAPSTASGRRAALAGIVTAALLLSGCLRSVRDVHHYSTQQLGPSLSMVTASSQLIVTNADGSICVGPPPDATSDLGISASVSVLGGAEQGGAAGGEEELPLGGRNPNVLVTRDLLFQSCLAEARLNLSPEERKAHHAALMQLIAGINGHTLEGVDIQTDAESASQRVTLPGVFTRPSDDSSDDDD
jgi:hypothetical protein